MSWLELVRQQMRSLDFGIRQIVTQEARSQRTEKIRLETPLPAKTEETNFARQRLGGRHNDNG
jgi:hypothetical protein